MNSNVPAGFDEGKTITLMINTSHFQADMIKKLVSNPFGLGMFLNAEIGKEFSADVDFNYFIQIVGQQIEFDADETSYRED